MKSYIVYLYDKELQVNKNVICENYFKFISFLKTLNTEKFEIEEMVVLNGETEVYNNQS
jgi:hypothetical protein